MICDYEGHQSSLEHQILETPIPLFSKNLLKEATTLYYSKNQLERRLQPPIFFKHQIERRHRPPVSFKHQLGRKLQLHVLQDSTYRGLQSSRDPPFHPHFLSIFIILSWTLFMFFIFWCRPQRNFLSTTISGLYSISTGQDWTIASFENKLLHLFI